MAARSLHAKHSSLICAGKRMASNGSVNSSFVSCWGIIVMESIGAKGGGAMGGVPLVVRVRGRVREGSVN